MQDAAIVSHVVEQPARRYLLVLLLASVVTLTPRPASACTCGDRPSVTEALAGADAVFVGELVAESELGWSGDASDRSRLDYDPSESVASYFVVTRVFVGQLRVGERVRVLNADHGSSCDVGGYGQLGRTWLLLVWGSSGDYEGGNHCTLDRIAQPSARLLRKVERAVAQLDVGEVSLPPLRRRGCQVADADASHGAWSLALLLGLVGARRRRRAIHSRACRSSTPSSPTPPRCMPRSS